jgi:hypothetical protein
MFNIGDNVVIRLKYSNPTTALPVNPATFALAIKFPDGSTRTIVELTKNAEGDYQYEQPVDVPGIYDWHCRTTGPRTSTGNQSFTVAPSDFEAS